MWLNMRGSGLFYADIHNLGIRSKAQGIGRLQIQAASPNKPDARNSERGNRSKMREREKGKRKKDKIGGEKKGGSDNVTRTKCEVVGFFVCAF